MIVFKRLINEGLVLLSPMRFLKTKSNTRPVRADPHFPADP
jgi:hypothetical protein